MINESDSGVDAGRYSRGPATNNMRIQELATGKTSMPMCSRESAGANLRPTVAEFGRAATCSAILLACGGGLPSSRQLARRRRAVHYQTGLSDHIIWCAAAPRFPGRDARS